MGRYSDPVKFLFEVREPSETLRYVSESVMREVVGDRTVDEVITIGRQEIETEDRMISERRQIAERFLSEGNGEAARIRGNRVRDLNKMTVSTSRWHVASGRYANDLIDIDSKSL